MKQRNWLAAVLCATLGVTMLSTDASAFCGVIEKTSTSYSAERASKRAVKRLNRDVRNLKREHGDKLVLDEMKQSCVGGALAIGADGKEVEGPSRCTATQSFCVNP